MTVKTVNADEANVTTRVRIFDATTSLPATGITSATSGLGLYYERERAAQTSITPASLSAATDAHTDGGFIELGDGWYRLDLPDAAVAANAKSVQVGVTLSGYVAFGPTLLIEAPVYVTNDALETLEIVLGAMVTTIVGTHDSSIDSQLSALSSAITTIDGIVDQILLDTGTDGVVIASGQTVAGVSGAVGSVTGNVGGNVVGSVGSLAAQAKADVNAEVVDCLVTDTYAEPASVPAATASLKDKIGWQAALARNKMTQTADTTTLRNDADSGNIGTSTRADDGTTATKGEWI